MKSTKDVPALPEDAEEIRQVDFFERIVKSKWVILNIFSEILKYSYKEICKDDQLQIMTKENNTWNQEFCPSPCVGNGPCVRGSQCIGNF